MVKVTVFETVADSAARYRLLLAGASKYFACNNPSRGPPSSSGDCDFEPRREDCAGVTESSVIKDVEIGIASDIETVIVRG
jgi:hypothetical protein